MSDKEFIISPAEAADTVHTLLDNNEQLTMNLFWLILESPDAMVWSDRRNFIIAQSNERTPVWVWTDAAADTTAIDNAAEILSSRLCAHSPLHANLRTEHSAALLGAAGKYGLRAKKYMDMNAYVCREVISPCCGGSISAPTDADRPAMASLLVQLVNDGEHQTIPDEAADGFAAAMVGSERLFLWRDNGDVAAMAMIAHISCAEHAARINTVVTDRSKRGHGYAGALVAEICRGLLNEGIFPMLYADAANPSSNRAYQKIGFETVGHVSEFEIYKEC